MNYSELLSSKLSILVVESDERILKRLSVWIKAIASEVEAFNSPIEALNFLETHNIDIIIFSSEMSFMGSMEFLQKAKDIKEGQVSVLMLEEMDIELFKVSISLGVDKYLNRPIDAKILIQVVEELAREKVFQMEFEKQNKLLSEYKDAIDKTFVVSKHSHDGKINFVNDAFCKLFDLREDEEKRELYNPLFDETGAKVNEIWEILETQAIYRGRREYVDDSQKSLIVDVNIIPIVNNNDEIDEYIAFLTDVTELVQSGRKLSDEKIQRLQAQKQHNEEMNRVKDSFLTVFTHELRTPLNAIINFSEHASKQVSKEEFRKKESVITELDAIHESGISILDMINNVMDAMKLRDKTILFTMREFSIAPTLKSIVDRLKYLSVDKKVDVTIVNDFTLISDDTRFSQIFLNIISNAFKYSSSHVKIYAKSNESKFGVVVEDDGEGIKDTSKIFELFEQLSDDEMTRTATGVGVGLFIVKQLCDAFGYNISIDTSPKLGGAKISITGPLKAKNGNE